MPTSPMRRAACRALDGVLPKPIPHLRIAMVEKHVAGFGASGATAAWRLFSFCRLARRHHKRKTGARRPSPCSGHVRHRRRVGRVSTAQDRTRAGTRAARSRWRAAPCNCSACARTTTRMRVGFWRRRRAVALSRRDAPAPERRRQPRSVVHAALRRRGPGATDSRSGHDRRGPGREDLRADRPLWRSIPRPW